MVVKRVILVHEGEKNYLFYVIFYVSLSSIGFILLSIHNCFPLHCVDLQKQGPIKEEFSDWPHGLLAIGTFGNSDMKENPESQNLLHQEDPSSSEDLADFTPEEIGKLQKELTKLLSRKPASNVEKEIAELPLDKFLNCPSSLNVDRRISATLCSDSDDKDEEIEKTISVILGRCREVCTDHSKKSIGKRSLSFLLKKMFVCRSGFAPAPSLRDTLQESRMEKVNQSHASLLLMQIYWVFFSFSEKGNGPLWRNEITSLHFSFHLD